MLKKDERVLKRTKAYGTLANVLVAAISAYRDHKAGRSDSDVATRATLSFIAAEGVRQILVRTNTCTRGPAAATCFVVLVGTAGGGAAEAGSAADDAGLFGTPVSLARNFAGAVDVFQSGGQNDDSWSSIAVGTGRYAKRKVESAVDDIGGAVEDVGGSVKKCFGFCD